MRKKTGSFLFLAIFRDRVVPPLAFPLALVFLAFTLSGCLSTSVSLQAVGEPETSGVIVRVFKNSQAEKAGVANAPGTLTEIYKLDGIGETLLQRSLASEWGVDHLEPGKYRLRIPAVIDRMGNIRETRAGDTTTDFKVKKGRTTVVKVVLKRNPKGLIVAAVVTVVFIVVALAILMGENDIKPPPLPPVPRLKHLHVPLPRPVVVANEFYIFTKPPGTGYREPIPAPRVTSAVPGPGSVVPAGIIIPTLTLSQPIDENWLRQGTMKMLGSKSGIIVGETVYENGLLRFQHWSSLVPGEIVTVTVYAGGVVNPKGKRMTTNFSWVFTIKQ